MCSGLSHPRLEMHPGSTTSLRPMDGKNIFLTTASTVPHFIWCGAELCSANQRPMFDKCAARGDLPFPTGISGGCIAPWRQPPVISCHARAVRWGSCRKSRTIPDPRRRGCSRCQLRALALVRKCPVELGIDERVLVKGLHSGSS